MCVIAGNEIHLINQDLPSHSTEMVAEHDPGELTEQMEPHKGWASSRVNEETQIGFQGDIHSSDIGANVADRSRGFPSI